MIAKNGLFLVHKVKLSDGLKGKVISPHISIYQPQISWILSIGHRMSGALLGSALFAGAIGYALDAEKTRTGFGYIFSSSNKASEHSSRSNLFTLRTLAKLMLRPHH